MVMEKLTNIADYFRWRLGKQSQQNVPEEREGRSSENNFSDVGCEFDTSNRFLTIMESILLWENPVNTIVVLVVFNLLFWGIDVFEVHGFAAASSAALVVFLCYSTLEAQANKDKTQSSQTKQARSEQLGKILHQIQFGVESLKELRKEQPGVFCASICAISLGLWLTGRAVSGTFLAYTIFMSILLGPALLVHIPSKVLSSKEWDSEVEEFLPAVTEDNLQVLQRAGDSGLHSLTPTSLSAETNIDPFNEEELVGLKMPSHEDGSTDGLELSELELSAEDVEVDGIKFQSGHFERGSSSEEEAELEPQKIPHCNDDSDSEFEIIESHEVANVRNG